MTERPTPDIKWSVRKRLEFIEFRLFWNGRLNRIDLADAFGISSQQASADIAQYRQLAPENLAYDTAQKTYVRTPRFQPLLVGKSADRYLLQTVAIASGWMQQEETWFETLPPVEIATLGRRATNPKYLLAILDAIRSCSQLMVDYQSMTGSPDSWRSIAPHALAYNAGRWYVRAWSKDHNDFRDYNLNRIHGVREPYSCDVDHSLDYEWAQKINLILLPNPSLSQERQSAIASEYNMVDGKLTVPVRLSLSFYLMAEHNLEIPNGVLAPEKQQLILQNREDVEQARRLARQISKEALERATPL